MSEEELGALAKQILDTATLKRNADNGVITVDSDLLFRYYLFRNMDWTEEKRNEHTQVTTNKGE